MPVSRYMLSVECREDVCLASRASGCLRHPQEMQNFNLHSPPYPFGRHSGPLNAYVDSRSRVKCMNCGLNVDKESTFDLEACPRRSQCSAAEGRGTPSRWVMCCCCYVPRPDGATPSLLCIAALRSQTSGAREKLASNDVARIEGLERQG